MRADVIIKTAQRDDGWTAWAERTATGDRFGIECRATTEADARARLAAWIDWQEAHTAALKELQDMERAYHRTIAGSAFASAIEGPSPIELQKDALDRLEAARRRLDDVRGRKPE